MKRIYQLTSLRYLAVFSLLVLSFYILNDFNITPNYTGNLVLESNSHFDNINDFNNKADNNNYNAINNTYNNSLVQVYFCQTQNCTKALLDYIENTEYSLYCAFYDINLDSVKEKLIQKDAQVLLDEDNIDKFPDAYEIDSKGLMHNKFCIRDNEFVLTGSMNPTFRGTQKNDNNLVFIDSKSVAKLYLDEWYEIKSSQNFKTENSQFLINNYTYYFYFSPEDDVEGKILSTLDKAQKSIKFMTFTFTSDPIGDLLLYKLRNNISISGIFEARQKSRYWEYEKLKSAGANVFTDTNPATMHHKVFIIDDKILITGSYNPTKSANKKNDENIFITSDPNIVNQYINEFNRVYLRDSLNN